MPKAKNLKYCRRRANLSQQAFADAIGVSKSTVTAWESKRHAIPVRSTKRIADFFNVDYDDFCDCDLEHDQKTTEIHLSEQEQQSILMFRQLPKHIKALVRHVISLEYERLENKDESGDKR